MDAPPACTRLVGRAFKAAPPFLARKAPEPAEPHPRPCRPACWENGSRPGGALAGSIEGEEGGASVSELTEAAAREKSIANCERQGGGRCKVVFVYQNQCVSAVTSELASTGTKYVTAASEEIATKLAVQDCEKAGGKQCRSIYSACTVPFFKKY